MYHEKYLETKVKSCEGKINTSFHDDGKPRVRSHCICVSVIFIESVFEVDKYYYSHVFLEECKYISKEKRFFCNDFDQEDSNEEVSENNA